MERVDQYARCTAALRARMDQPGAEGLFDQALNNGLAAIVAKRWPGEEVSGKGPRVKFASELLDVIERHARRGGTVELEDIEPEVESVFGEPISPRATVIDLGGAIAPGP
jgi:hypothetical protein